MNQIGLNRKVIVEKFCGEGAVRENPAHLSRRDDDVRRIRFSEKLLDLPAVSQIQLLTGPTEQILVPLSLQPPHESRPYHTPMAGDINARLALHGLTLLRGDRVFRSVTALALSLEIRIHHHRGELLKPHFRLPLQLPFRFTRVANK